MPMVKSLGEKAAELNRMLQALCLRNPGVRALCPKATAFKNEHCSGVLVYTLEGSLRIHSRSRAAAGRITQARISKPLRRRVAVNLTDIGCKT